MTAVRAAELLKELFPEYERLFLLSHPEFKKALRLVAEDRVFDLSYFGVVILRESHTVSLN